MTRLAVAVAMVAGGLVALVTDSPDAPVVIASAHKLRPHPFRVSRSARRLPLAATPPVHPAKARRHVHRPGPSPSGRATSHDLREPADVLTVTMYCYTGSRNAAGNWPTVGTAAANAYPLGTRLHVEGIGTVTVEDRSAPGATDVDVYGGTDAGCATRAAQWGRRSLHVWRVAA